jgi:hypothetical protein
MMQGILHEGAYMAQFLVVTCLLGGWTAWMAGRGCARIWGSPLRLFLYLLVLGAAIRFINYALFEDTLLSLQYYAVDTFVLMVLGFLGYQYTRTNQMVTQYNWLYAKTSPLSWKTLG